MAGNKIRIAEFGPRRNAWVFHGDFPYTHGEYEYHGFDDDASHIEGMRRKTLRLGLADVEFHRADVKRLATERKFNVVFMQNFLTDPNVFPRVGDHLRAALKIMKRNGEIRVRHTGIWGMPDRFEELLAEAAAGLKLKIEGRHSPLSRQWVLRR